MKISVPRVKMFTHERANRNVGRSDNLGGQMIMSVAQSAPLVEIGLTDLPKNEKVGCPTNPLGSNIPHQTETQPDTQL